MTLNKIQQTVVDQCHNYFKNLNKIHNCCCARDGVCFLFREDGFLPCKYFEKSVLPIMKDNSASELYNSMVAKENIDAKV